MSETEQHQPDLPEETNTKEAINPSEIESIQEATHLRVNGTPRKKGAGGKKTIEKPWEQMDPAQYLAEVFLQTAESKIEESIHIPEIRDICRRCVEASARPGKKFNIDQFEQALLALINILKVRKLSPNIAHVFFSVASALCNIVDNDHYDRLKQHLPERETGMQRAEVQNLLQQLLKEPSEEEPLVEDEE